MEALGTTMQLIRTVIDRQPVHLAVEGECSPGDAVAYPTDDRAVKRLRTGDVFLKRVEPGDHIPERAIAIGHQNAHRPRTITRDGHLHTVGVLQDKQIGLLPVDRLSEVSGLEPELRRGGCRPTTGQQHRPTHNNCQTCSHAHLLLHPFYRGIDSSLIPASMPRRPCDFSTSCC